VSVNCTACPAAGEAGLKVNETIRAGATVNVWVAVLEAVLLLTDNVTVFDPAAVYVWLGFWAVDVVPSPKFQDQEVGLPADVSVN